MSYDSDERWIKAVRSIWAATLALSAVAILIPTARWFWSPQHILWLVAGVALAKWPGRMPETPWRVLFFSVWLLDAAWSVCYIYGIVRHDCV